MSLKQERVTKPSRQAARKPGTWSIRRVVRLSTTWFICSRQVWLLPSSWKEDSSTGFCWVDSFLPSTLSKTPLYTGLEAVRSRSRGRRTEGAETGASGRRPAKAARQAPYSSW